MSDINFTLTLEEPKNPITGQMYLSVDPAGVFVYDGTKWLPIDGEHLNPNTDPNVMWFRGEKFVLGKVNHPRGGEDSTGWWEDNGDDIVAWVSEIGGEVILDTIGYHTIVLPSEEALSFFTLKWGA